MAAPLRSPKSRDLVAFVAPSCIKVLRLVTALLPEKSLPIGPGPTELRPNGVLGSSGQNSYSTSAPRPVEYSQHSGYRASLPPPEAPGPGTALRTGPSAQLRLSARTIASPVLLLSLFTQRLRSRSVLRSFELASSTRPAGTSSVANGTRVRRRSWPAQLPCLPHYEASRTRS